MRRGKECVMSKGIPEKVNGYILRDERCVPIEDVETLYREIVTNIDDRAIVLGILQRLIVECIRNGKHEAALSYIEKAFFITDDPTELARIHLAIGTVYERARDYRSAAERYKAAFTLPKEEDETWYFLNNNLGYSLNQLGRCAEAEGYCRAAIGIAPGLHNAHKNLGVALQGQGRYAEAATCFLQAALISPHDPRSLSHLDALLREHLKEVLRDIPNIDEQITAVAEISQRVTQ
jgi:tetratricopeptide (TPR) repeat protein